MILSHRMPLFLGSAFATNLVQRRTFARCCCQSSRPQGSNAGTCMWFSRTKHRLKNAATFSVIFLFFRSRSLTNASLCPCFATSVRDLLERERESTRNAKHFLRYRLYMQVLDHPNANPNLTLSMTGRKCSERGAVPIVFYTRRADAGQVSKVSRSSKRRDG